MALIEGHGCSHMNNTSAANSIVPSAFTSWVYFSIDDKIDKLERLFILQELSSFNSALKLLAAFSATKNLQDNL